ncbi:MAG: efflux RND transporter permease subunit, partial [Pseudomonadota bacterium]
MYTIIEAAITHSRTTLCILLMIILSGLVARATISIEADPEVIIPIALVTIPHPGISPEDAERLISRPMETELRSIEGLDEIMSYSREGVAALILEFDVSMDIDEALVDVREAVDRAQVEIPSTAEEPLIEEVSMTDYPVIVVSLASDSAPERVLYNLAIKVRDEIESISLVREAQLSGHREELLEAVVDPSKLETHGISQQSLINAVVNNNSLIAAGAMDTGQGRFAVKVPGLIETHQDVFDLPLKSTDNAVVTVADVADIRRTFKDRENYTRVNGKPALSVQVLKRPGSNLIQTNQAVREVVDKMKGSFPPGIEVIYSQDQSPFAAQQVEELQGNILTAMALVMTLVVAALGLRSGMLVGVAIPVSILFSLILLNYIDYSFNFMVMFGMLLALGMLIDGAIVVTEYADRKMVEGQSPQSAYIMAAKRMFWPVTASTATTLAAFLPLFMWPGVSGQFMLYLPVTAFTILVGSLFYALIFGPTLGAIFGKPGAVDEHSLRQMYE